MPCRTSHRLEHEKAMLKRASADRLAYNRNEGFRTLDLALPFEVFGTSSDPKTVGAPDRMNLSIG